MSKYKCVECGTPTTIMRLRDVGACPRCGDTNFTITYSERTKTMPNIKITAEVDGKIVPLNTISAESFEAIKALEKLKEIPAVRVGNWRDDQSSNRLFLKLTKSIIDYVSSSDNGTVLAIDPKNGIVATCWLSKKDKNMVNNYENVRPL